MHTGGLTPGIRERTPTTSPDIQLTSEAGAQTAIAGVQSWGVSRKQGLQALLCGDPGPSFSLTRGKGVCLAMVPTASGSSRCSPAPGGCPPGPDPWWAPGDVAVCRPGWAVSELLALDAWPRPAVHLGQKRGQCWPRSASRAPWSDVPLQFSRADGPEQSVVASQLLLG